MEKFISMANFPYEFVDGRRLLLNLNFHELNEEHVFELCDRCYKYTQEFLGESFVTEWTSDSRPTKPADVMRKLEERKKNLTFHLHGNVISNSVYNKKTLKAYRHRLLYESHTPGRETSVSKDYPEMFCLNYAGAKTPEAIKAATLKIFNTEHKNAIVKWRTFDVFGGFFQHWTPDDFITCSGSYYLQIAIGCLGSYVDKIAEEFCSFSKELASTFPGISGYVSLTPFIRCGNNTAYGHYFSSMALEWNPYKYVTGVEWFHILSPMQRSLVPDLLTDATREANIEVKELNKGGVVVRIGKGVLETDVPEYLALKRVMYDALYPGGRTIELAHWFDSKLISPSVKPRILWEYIPVFDDEVTVLEDRIIFRHANAPLQAQK